MKRSIIRIGSLAGLLMTAALAAACSSLSANYGLAGDPPSLQAAPTVCVGASASRIPSRQGAGETCREDAVVADFL